MEIAVILALAGFALVSSITPGPNNLMLMASGANFGFRRTVPHLLGVNIGFAVMLALVGFGLMRVFDQYPLVYQVLRVVSVVYLVYLAWKIATAAGVEGEQGSATPLKFWQAALFQWVNPKAWSMALTAISVYAPGYVWQSVSLVVLTFSLVNLPCVSLWTALGQRLQRWLVDVRRARVFNMGMAGLLLLTLYPVLNSVV